jgi:putative membrane protein
MKQKPFKREITEENNIPSDDLNKIKPFKVESDETLDIENEDITIEDTVNDTLSTAQGSVGFFNTLTGVISAIFIFVVFAVLADTIGTISNIFVSGSLSEYIYLTGLLILLFVLILNIMSSIKQLRFIKNAEQVKKGFKEQKEKPTKDIIHLADILLQHLEKNPDEKLKKEILVIRDELNSSQIYKEIYYDLDKVLLPILDEKAKQIIHKASVQAALSTAISPIPLFDMALIVWRSVLLTKDIAALYGFRSGRLTIFFLLKRGVLNVAFAGVSELATEATNEIAGTSILSKVSKSAGQGIANGVLLARLGYGVMEACRPIDFSEGRASFVSSILKSIVGSFGFSETKNIS